MDGYLTLVMDRIKEVDKLVITDREMGDKKIDRYTFAVKKKTGEEGRGRGSTKRTCFVRSVLRRAHLT